MDYNTLRKQTNVGWNTWNAASVLSHVLLPYGFAINLCLKDHSNPKVIRSFAVGRFGEDEEHLTPGVRSYDGSYTEMKVQFANTEFFVQSTVVDEQQLLYITPLKNGIRPASLIVEACILWGRDGSVTKQGERLWGDFPDGKHIEIYSDGTRCYVPYSYSLSPSFALSLDKPVCVSTVPCTVLEAQKLVSAAKEKMLAYEAKYGAHAEAHTAMSSCMAWDTIYEPEHDRLCSPVSRIWCVNWGGYVLFDWDTYFGSMIAAVDDKELAYLNAFAITHEMTENGFVPNFGAADDYKTRDRSQPPVGSMAILEIYRRYREDWFVKELYPYLLRWNRWFAEKRMTKEGYLCWGSNHYEPVSGHYFERSDTHNKFGSMLESGLDNSPMYDDVSFDLETELMQLADVGLMGLYIKDCKCLIELALIAEQEEDIPELAARCSKVEEALSDLWSEEDGMFENKDLVTGELSNRISPTNFYALYSGKVTDAQKDSMLKKYFYNPQQFWGEYILPSIARCDPGYPDQTYWRGRIWAPMNLLVYLALKDAGLSADANVLAKKSEQLLLKEWRAHGHVHENYSGDDGWGCGVANSDKFYHWGGLLGYIALMEE